MFYKFNLSFLLLLSLNGLIEAQEYSITSDKIEINTDIDRIIYEDNVSFESENVTFKADKLIVIESTDCLLYTSPSPRDRYISRMPSSA